MRRGRLIILFALLIIVAVIGVVIVNSGILGGGGTTADVPADGTGLDVTEEPAPTVNVIFVTQKNSTWY